MAFAIAVAGGLVVFADSDGGNDALAFAYTDDANAARGAPRNADTVDRTADQRAAVGHQHDLVVLQHREGRHDLTALGEVHQLDALAAAAGDPVLVGRGALAETRRSHGQHELFLVPQRGEALG